MLKRSLELMIVFGKTSLLVHLGQGSVVSVRQVEYVGSWSPRPITELPLSS